MEHLPDRQDTSTADSQLAREASTVQIRRENKGKDGDGQNQVNGLHLLPLALAATSELWREKLAGPQTLQSGSLENMGKATSLHGMHLQRRADALGPKGKI